MYNHSQPTYQKLCTEFYDLWPHPLEEEALPFYMHYAQQAQGAILEPMCGTGRFLIPMLQAGFDAQGFDASPFMLDALRQKYAAISTQQAPVWQQCAQDFTSDKLYKLIFVPYGSWGLMTSPDDATKALQRMYDHLAPGGKFVVEIETVASAPQSTGIWKHVDHTRTDGSQLVLNFITSYNIDTQMFSSKSRYESIYDGLVTETEEENFTQYLYRFDEMDSLLKTVGFTNIAKYQDHKKTPATDLDAHLIIYECTKETLSQQNR